MKRIFDSSWYLRAGSIRQILTFSIFKRRFSTEISGKDGRPGKFHKEALKISVSKILLFPKVSFWCIKCKKKKIQV